MFAILRFGRRQEVAPRTFDALVNTFPLELGVQIVVELRRAPRRLVALTAIIAEYVGVCVVFQMAVRAT